MNNKNKNVYILVNGKNNHEKKYKPLPIDFHKIPYLTHNDARMVPLIFSTACIS